MGCIMNINKDEAQFLLGHLNYPTDNSRQELFYEIRLKLRNYVGYADNDGVLNLRKMDFQTDRDVNCLKRCPDCREHHE